MLNIILSYIYHYIKQFFPYIFIIILIISGIFTCGLPGFFIGRWYERLQWRKDIKSGKRLGELIHKQLKDRDNRIEHLTSHIAIREEQTELIEAQQKRLVNLSHKMIEVVMEVNIETLKRRRILR